MTIWTRLSDLELAYEPPLGYTFEQLRREDIPALIARLQVWDPGIGAGSLKHYLDPRYYEAYTSLAGEDHAASIVYIGKRGDELVCMASLRIDDSAKVLFGEFGIVSPLHRGRGLSSFAGAAMIAHAYAARVAVALTYVTLRTPALQQSLEQVGFRPVGIVPCSDRELTEKGARHVSEVLYARVFARPESIQEPEVSDMTPAVARIWYAMGFPV
jgi:hypothetical protein